MSRSCASPIVFISVSSLSLRQESETENENESNGLFHDRFPLESMSKVPNPRESHCDFMFITSRDAIGVFYTSARLNDKSYSGRVGGVNGISKGEKRIADHDALF